MPRKPKPSKMTVGWIRWMAACGLPRAAIIAVLDLQEPFPSRVAETLERPFRGSAKPRRPKPDNRNPQRPSLRGRAAGKCTRMTLLGFGPKTIARVLGVSLREVVRHQRWGAYHGRRPGPIPSPWYAPGDARLTAVGPNDLPGADAGRAPAVDRGVSTSSSVAEPPAAPPVEPSPNRWERATEDMASRKLTPDDRRRVHELRAEGLSTGELAEAFGVRRATICYTLARPPSPSVSPALPLPEEGEIPHPRDLPCK